MLRDVEMRDGSAGSCGKSKEIVEAQRTYYMEGKTRALSARIDALNRLEQSILTYEQELYQALRSDLGKSRAESYMCEVGLTLSELRYVRRHVKSWSRNRRVHTPLAQFHAASFTVQEPYGVVLIMSPWNYHQYHTQETCQKTTKRQQKNAVCLCTDITEYIHERKPDNTHHLLPPYTHQLI